MLQKLNLQLQVAGVHFLRQLQLLTVQEGAEGVYEGPEEVLVTVEKVDEMVGFAPGSSCSQIDSPAFLLSLSGLTTVLLAAWTLFKGFTT